MASYHAMLVAEVRFIIFTRIRKGCLQFVNFVKVSFQVSAYWGLNNIAATLNRLPTCCVVLIFFLLQSSWSQESTWHWEHWRPQYWYGYHQERGSSLFWASQANVELQVWRDWHQVHLGLEVWHLRYMNLLVSFSWVLWKKFSKRLTMKNYQTCFRAKHLCYTDLTWSSPMWLMLGFVIYMYVYSSWSCLQISHLVFLCLRS